MPALGKEVVSLHDSANYLKRLTILQQDEENAVKKVNVHLRAAAVCVYLDCECDVRARDSWRDSH